MWGWTEPNVKYRCQRAVVEEVNEKIILNHKFRLLILSLSNKIHMSLPTLVRVSMMTLLIFVISTVCKTVAS